MQEGYNVCKNRYVLYQIMNTEDHDERKLTLTICLCPVNVVPGRI